MSGEEEQTTCQVDILIKSDALTQKFAAARNQTLTQMSSIYLVVVGAMRSPTLGEANNEFIRFLLACWDNTCGKFVIVCSVAAGFFENKQELSEKLARLIIPNPSDNVIFNQKYPAQVWFDPITVWEIKCGDVCLSPMYLAGQGLIKEGVGFSLRFPYFVREKPFRKPQDITSVNDLVNIHRWL